MKAFQNHRTVSRLVHFTVVLMFVLFILPMGNSVQGSREDPQCDVLNERITRPRNNREKNLRGYYCDQMKERGCSGYRKLCEDADSSTNKENANSKCSWSGQWDIHMKDSTNGKEPVILTLRQTGDSVSGAYALWYNGKIKDSTADGLTLSGKWSNNFNGGDGGTFKITMNADCRSWAGTWTSTIKGGSGSWSGARVRN